MRMNPVSHWFRPKRLGIGWSPATWEGWTATLVAVAALVTAARVFGQPMP